MQHDKLSELLQEESRLATSYNRAVFAEQEFCDQPGSCSSSEIWQMIVDVKSQIQRLEAEKDD